MARLSSKERGQHAAPFPSSRFPAVNVAQVPQRSLLRYPGGKTWLIPHIREWLTKTKPKILIEPFAGGGIVSLTAVMEELVERAIMVEIDHDVAAFWHAALRDGATLAKKIRHFTPTHGRVKKLERQGACCVTDHGFRTLILNRTRKAGILAPGASYNKHGENGKGIRSRWYPDTLATRLEAIEKHAEKITFCEADGMKILEPLLHGWGHTAAVFLDPPYTAGGKRAGARLYAHSEIDHAGLFKLLARRHTNFLMTYDCAPEIIELIDQHDFHAVTVQMKNAHHRHQSELVVTREPMFS
ncbi:MAG: DNA adenine methylase [Gammaproteobacteria bacterium]|nr:DNA adenine methylase [Gammaproteobacteria bacterium]